MAQPPEPRRHRPPGPDLRHRRLRNHLHRLRPHHQPLRPGAEFAIERGTLPPSDRAYYTLPVSHPEVPVINTCAAALDWVQRLESGESARTGDGGPGMAWPNISEVAATATALTTAENAQALTKLTYDQLQESIATQRPAVDLLIADLWDTIEYNLRHNDASSLRRKAREWGVVYQNDDGTEETDPPEPPPVP